MLPVIKNTAQDLHTCPQPLAKPRHQWDPTRFPWNLASPIWQLLRSVTLLVLHVFNTRITLCKGSANDRRHYNVTSSLIGWAHTQNDPFSMNFWYLWHLSLIKKMLWGYVMVAGQRIGLNVITASKIFRCKTYYCSICGGSLKNTTVMP